MPIDRRTFLATAAAVPLLAGAEREKRPPPRIRCERDTTIEEAALNFEKGPFGTCINGQTFQQEALLSFKGRQYAAWFADGGLLCIGRRALPEGKWEVVRFADYRIKHNDVHNVAVLGVCPADGTLHLAFDHHVHPLHYRRSVAGAAHEPERFAWEAKLFGEITAALEPGKPLRGVTYPLFFSTPHGRLQLVYRIGGSGAGDWFLAEYDAEPKGWQVLGKLFSGTGTFETSQSRCAYPNPFRYGPGNRLHATWCWRERPKGVALDLTTNHGVHYAFSEDYGRTWKNNAGAVVGVLGPNTTSPQAISIASPGIRVWDAPYRRGMMNTTTEYVDPRGRVHVVNWQLPAESTVPSLDMNQWRYDHYWRDEKGAWHTNRLPFHGRKPQIVLDRSGLALLVFCRGKDHNYHDRDPGGDLCIAAASEQSQWKDWQIIHQQHEWFVGEPLLDIPRLADRAGPLGLPPNRPQIARRAQPAAGDGVYATIVGRLAHV